MTEIELEAKSDRELLILNVQTTNNLCDQFNQMNGRLKLTIEKQAAMEAVCEERHPKYSNIKRVGTDAGLIGIIVALVEALKLLIGKV